MKLFYLVVLLVLSMFCIKASAATAEADSTDDLFDMSIEELMNVEVDTVYSASKYGQRISEAPSSVTVITADDIQKFGYRNLGDILNSVPGFYTTYDRNYTYVGVRGFGRTGDYNSRVLVLIDGYRANENVYDSAYVGNDFFVDVDLIDRVEIIRGPRSSLYSSSAFFAVVNVITKKGSDYEGAEVSGTVSDYETHKQRYTFGKKFASGADLLMSVSDYRSAGQTLYFREFDDPSTNSGIARHADTEKYYNAISKLIYGDFTVEGALIWREKRIPTAAWGTVFNDNRTDTRDKSGVVGIKYEHDFDGELGVIARVYYGTYDYYGHYILPEPYVNYDYAHGSWIGTELRFSKRLGERHKLIWGGEWQSDFQQDQGNYDIYGDYLDDERESERRGVFVQDEFRVTDKLTLITGVRLDDHGGTKMANPRVAAIYKLCDHSTLKLLYGRAYRAPNIYERYYNDGGYSQKANPGLNPEKIRTYEAVIEHEISDNLRGTVSGFIYEIEDLITLVTDSSDGLLVFRNSDKVKAKGFEVGLDRKWDSGWRTKASYSFVRTDDTGTDSSLTNSPRHLAKFHVVAPLVKDKVFAGLEALGIGEKKTLGANHADGHFVTNLTIFGKDIAKNVDASFSIYNLLDEKYGHPGSGEHAQDIIYQDGRTFWFELTGRFK